MKFNTIVLSLGAFCTISLAAPIDVKPGTTGVAVAKPGNNGVIGVIDFPGSETKRDTIVPVVPLDSNVVEGYGPLEKRDTGVPVVPLGGEVIEIIDIVEEGISSPA